MAKTAGQKKRESLALKLAAEYGRVTASELVNELSIEGDTFQIDSARTLLNRLASKELLAKEIEEIVKGRGKVPGNLRWVYRPLRT